MTDKVTDANCFPVSLQTEPMFDELTNFAIIELTIFYINPLILFF